MWELDHKESWELNNWCFWTVVLEKTLESLLDYKEIKAINPKGNQSWIFIGGTDAEAETPIFWPPDTKNWLIGKDPDTGEDWRQEEKGMTEDEMVRWHHWLSGHEFEQTPRDGSTGKPGMLQSMGSPRVGHKRATEQHMTPKTTVCKKYTTPSANKLLLTSASKAILKVNSLSPKYRLNCFWIMRVKIVVLP